MTLDPLSLLIGAGAAGLAAFAVWAIADHAECAGGDGAGSYGSGPTLRGHVIPGTTGVPSPAGLLPRAGYATREDYEWGYATGPGDTAEGIAQAITGDEGRYQELLLANPQIKMIGEAGVYLGHKAWGFEGDLAPGTPLLLPLPWSRYVDQVGRPRGSTTPWPPDPRSSSVLVSGAQEIHGGEVVPYDRPVALGVAAEAA